MQGKFLLFLCLIVPLPASSVGYANPQPDFIITQEDIENAVVNPPEVVLSAKEEHIVSVMERRHFEHVVADKMPDYRLSKLENYLLGRTWEFSPVNERLKRLKLASQRKMLSGASIPPSIRRNFSPQRIANDSTPVYENEDNVGLIDGFMRLLAPDIYHNWSERKKKMSERYSDG